MLRFYLQALLAMTCSSHTVSAHGAELEVLSAIQPAPGHVVITIAAQGVPVRDEIALLLDDAPPVRAERITPLPTPQQPLWLMLCLDRSGSIGAPALEGLKVGLLQALVRDRSGGLPFKVALMSFATRPAHVLDFTSDTAEVAAAIDQLTIESGAGGRTRMYDAIAGGIAALTAQGEGRKRLIVVSDGKDEGSSVTADKLAHLTRGPGQVVIDALALGAWARENAGELSSVAGGSGGRFLPSPDMNDAARPLARLIAEAAPPSRFQVGFSYAVAPGSRNARSASLAYVTDTNSNGRTPLPVVLAAAESSGAEPSNPIKVDTTFTFKVVVDWLRSVPALLSLLAAASLALALGLAYRHKHKADDNVKTGVLIVEEHKVGVLVEPQRARRSATSVGHSWQEPGPGRPVALLRGMSGSARGQVVPIEKAMFTVGCDPNSDLVLVGDDFASGAHALLRFEAGGMYVEDLGSTNGTHLNGGMFKGGTRAVAPGDELRFGHTTFQIQAPQQARNAGRSGIEPPPG